MAMDHAGSPRLDLEAIRRDFPALDQRVHEKPLVYLDSAATALKPVLSAHRMVPVTAAVSIPSVSEKVQDGVFVPYDAAISGANSMLEELQRWSGALQPLRAGIG